MEGVIAKLEALVVKLEQSGSHGASVGKVEILFCPGPSVIETHGSYGIEHKTMKSNPLNLSSTKLK